MFVWGGPGTWTPCTASVSRYLEIKMDIAIIQARTSSTRLPKKVLLPLGDTTVLGHTIRRVKLSNVRKIVVATSTSINDDPIEQIERRLREIFNEK